MLSLSRHGQSLAHTRSSSENARVRPCCPFKSEVPLILIGASRAPIAGPGAASVIIRWMVTFDPVRGLRHIAKMVAAVMKIEAGSIWAVARIEGVEAPDTW